MDRETYDDCCFNCIYFEDGERIYHQMSPCAECKYSNSYFNFIDIKVEVEKDDFVEYPCPYCNYNNIVADEADICKHFDFINLEHNYVIYRFTQEEDFFKPIIKEE